MTPEQILDAMTEANRNWQDASAAAFHWGGDQELANELLAAAIEHGIQADTLLEGWTWDDAMAFLFDA